MREHDQWVCKFLSVQGRAKRSAAHKGKTLSLETRRKTSAAVGKRCEITYPDGETFTYPSVGEAARRHGLNRHKLSKVARGERNHHKGWTCRYLRKHLTPR